MEKETERNELWNEKRKKIFNRIERSGIDRWRRRRNSEKEKRYSRAWRNTGVYIQFLESGTRVFRGGGLRHTYPPILLSRGSRLEREELKKYWRFRCRRGGPIIVRSGKPVVMTHSSGSLQQPSRLFFFRERRPQKFHFTSVIILKCGV